MALTDLADKYGVSETTVAAACDLTLTREEWYRLFLSAGHPLP